MERTHSIKITYASGESYLITKGHNGEVAKYPLMEAIRVASVISGRNENKHLTISVVEAE